MTDTAIKTIGIKFPGATREMENLTVQPGTTVRDVLQSIGLGNDFTLTDPDNQDAVFNAGDNLYARVKDGDVLACIAIVDAGLEEANV